MRNIFFPRFYQVRHKAFVLMFRGVLSVLLLYVIRIWWHVILQHVDGFADFCLRCSVTINRTATGCISASCIGGSWLNTSLKCSNHISSFAPQSLLALTSLSAHMQCCFALCFAALVFLFSRRSLNCFLLSVRWNPFLVFSVSTSNWWIIVLHLPNSPSLTFYLSLCIAGWCNGPQTSIWNSACMSSFVRFFGHRIVCVRVSRVSVWFLQQVRWSDAASHLSLLTHLEDFF